MVEADLKLGDVGLLPQAGFQLGQHPLGVLPDGAQLVHLAVVPRRDDPAVLQGGGSLRVDGGVDLGFEVLHGVDAGSQLSQLGAAAALRQLFQLGQAVKGLGHGVDLFGGGRAVDGAGHQPLDVGDVAQRFGQLAPGDGLFDQAFHRVEPAVDDLAGDEGLFQPAAQQPLAHGGGRLVQHPEQGAPLFPPAHGLGQFQVGAGDGGQVHILRLGVADDRFEAADALDLGVVEVLQQAAHGVADQALGPDLGGAGPVPAKLPGQGGVDEAGGVFFVLHQLDGAVHVLFDVGRHLPAGQGAGVEQHLAGAVAAQLSDDRHADLGVFQLGDVGGAGGHIGKAQPRPVPFQVEAGDVVVAVILEHTALDDGAGGDHPDDLPFDQPLGQGGVLGLLADSHLVPLGDEARHIRLIAVERHAAHGGALFLAALLAGQGQVQLTGGRDSVVVEHLVKIADAVKEDLVLMLLFDLQVLFHHGRQIRHSIPLLSAVCVS